MHAERAPPDDETDFEKKDKMVQKFKQYNAEREKKQFDLDFFRQSFIEKYKMLNSEIGEEVFDALIFFDNFVLLAKDRNLVQFFLNYSNSLGSIITIFMNNSIPFNIEASLDLLTNIMTFVDIEISPSEIPGIVDRILELFTYGIPPLSTKLLNFMIIMNNNKQFCQLMTEKGAFDLSFNLIMGESKIDKHYFEIESEAFSGLLNFPFSPDCLFDILIQIENYIKNPRPKVKINGLSMISKILKHGVPVSDIGPILLKPSFIEEFLIPISAAPKKLLYPALKILTKIENDEFLEPIFDLDFRNNLAYQCIKKQLDSKTRTAIYKLFLRATPFFDPVQDDLIFIPAMRDTIESYRERKAILKLINAQCQKKIQFALDFSMVGSCALLAYSLDECMTSLSKIVFSILESIGHAFEATGRDIREMAFYDQIAEKLEDIKLLEEFSSAKKQATIQRLQLYYSLSYE